MFDDYPADISWAVKDLAGLAYGSGGGYTNALGGQTVAASMDLSVGYYIFEIADSYGDGLCCNEGTGSYTLSLDNTIFHTSSGRFGTGEAINFAVSSVSTVPLPAGGLLLLSGLIGFARLKRGQ